MSDTPCTHCAQWRKDFIELELQWHAEKKKTLEMAKELHVAKTLHSVAVTERENMSAELLRLKMQLEEKA